MVEVKAKIEINLMLEPSIVKIQQIPHTIDLSTQEGAYQSLETSAQERCALQSYKCVLNF
jgi:hypothetical protein